MDSDCDIPTQVTGVIIVDHGSRRTESNEMLLAVVDAYRRDSIYGIVEPAHMELAEPSIQSAFDRCVQQEAKLIVVHPYFLLPGRHWNTDIPRLVAEAARPHEGIRYLVTAPLGLHPLMTEVIQQRIEHCLQQAAGRTDACDVCEAGNQCRIQ